VSRSGLIQLQNTRHSRWVAVVVVQGGGCGGVGVWVGWVAIEPCVRNPSLLLSSCTVVSVYCRAARRTFPEYL